MRATVMLSVINILHVNIAHIVTVCYFADGNYNITDDGDFTGNVIENKNVFQIIYYFFI